MSFFKKHDILLKIVALLMAIFMWSFVVVSKHPPKTVRFSGVAVEMTGAEELADRGLILVMETAPKIDVNATGTADEMVKLSSADVKASVDFSNIQEASTYYMQPVVTVPKASSISFKPQRLQFKVENIVTKQVPVKVTTMNNLSDDRLIDTLTPSRTQVTIQGAESVVSTVEYALLTVDLQEIAEKMVQSCRVTLYNQDDAQVESPYVTCEEQELDVSVGVNHVVSLPLGVTLISSPELSKDMVGVQIQPKSIRVYGAKEIVDGLQSLSLGSIDLGQVQDDGQTFTLSIKLPVGVKLMEGEPKEARVLLSMQENANRTIRVTDIQLKDTSSSENKPEVALETSFIDITVQGKANVIAGVSASDIDAEVEFDSSALGAGTHTVPVHITIGKSGVTAVETELTVTVSVSAQEEEQEQT